jgi:hypothetical protein
METSETVQHYCPNCNESLLSKANFCHACGQKRTDGGNITFRAYAKEVLSDIFRFDSKLLRDPLLLLRPGFLTTEYFKGRHVGHLKPLRLFTFFTLSYFALLLVSFNKKNTGSGGDGWEDNYRKTLISGVVEQTDSLLRAQPDERPRATLDSLRASLTRQLGTDWADSTQLGNVVELAPMTVVPFKVANKDLYTLGPDQIAEKYGLHSFTARHFLRVQYNSRKAGRGTFAYIIGKLSWSVLLMVPVFALLMKLLYFRSGKSYVEHLVFGMHLHAFVFMILCLGMLIAYFVEDFWGAFALVFWLLATLYLYKAMRVYYQQGRLKTFAKMNLLGMGYLLASIFVVILVALVSIVLFY